MGWVFFPFISCVFCFFSSFFSYTMMRFFGVLFFLFFLMDFSIFLFEGCWKRWGCWKKPQKGDSFSFPTAPFWEGKLPKPVQKGGSFGSHNKINTKSTKLRIESNKHLTQIDSVSRRAAKLHLLYTCRGFQLRGTELTTILFSSIWWNSLLLGSWLQIRRELVLHLTGSLCFTFWMKFMA